MWHGAELVVVMENCKEREREPQNHKIKKIIEALDFLSDSAQQHFNRALEAGQNPFKHQEPNLHPKPTKTHPVYVF